MKKLTYQIMVYLMIALGVSGLVGMIVEAKLSQSLNVWALVCLCLMILGIVGLVLVQCIYRVMKTPLKTLNQTKECPKCHSVNDSDAEFCKNCGEKFHNF